MRLSALLIYALVSTSGALGGDKPPVYVGPGAPAPEVETPSPRHDDDEGGHVGGSSAADESTGLGACTSDAAKVAYQTGFELQQSKKSAEALKHFGACLKAEPGCVACAYEMGWAFWTLDRYADTVKVWKRVLKLMPEHPGANEYLAVAEGKAKEGGKRPKIKHPPIGARSEPKKASLKMQIVARFQSFEKAPKSKRDHYDADIDSPKSARFSADGKKVYVNSLEADKTLAYDTTTFARVGEISHVFTAENAGLFLEETAFDYEYDERFKKARRNIFKGKPVESELTHNGRYLWIPYYRRSYDPFGTNPSAVAIIDTQNDQIMRVMATGPIAKYATASPDGKYMAISHWGDNTLSLIDITADEPKDFKYLAHLVVEKALDLDNVGKVNRDKDCGFCVRGLAYSADSRYLFVARMGGAGGIGAFDLHAEGGPKYLGAIKGMKPKPRDILISHDGKWLYVSSTMSGYVSRIEVDRMIAVLNSKPRKKVHVMKGFEAAFVGVGPRSIRISPDDRYLFASVNAKMQIVAVDTAKMKVVSRIPADPYPVGMALSADGTQLWMTAQSRGGIGGNAVTVFKIDYGRSRKPKKAKKKPTLTKKKLRGNRKTAAKPASLSAEDAP